MEFSITFHQRPGCFALLGGVIVLGVVALRVTARLRFVPSAALARP